MSLISYIKKKKSSNVKTLMKLVESNSKDADAILNEIFVIIENLYNDYGMFGMKFNINNYSMIAKTMKNDGIFIDYNRIIENLALKLNYYTINFAIFNYIMFLMKQGLIDKSTVSRCIEEVLNRDNNSYNVMVDKLGREATRYAMNSLSCDVFSKQYYDNVTTVMVLTVRM